MLELVMSRTILIIAITVILLIAAFFALSLKEVKILPTSDSRKTIEFYGLTLAGFKDGKKSWELYAEKGHTERGDINFFENVRRALIFDKGKPLLKEVRANWLQVIRRPEKIEAEGSLEGWVKLNNEYTLFRAEKLRYSEPEKRSRFSEGISLEGRDFRLSAVETEINHEQEIAFLSQDVVLVQPGKVVMSPQARYHLKTKNVYFFPKVRVMLEKGEAILKEESLNRVKNPEARKALKEKTWMECANLEVSLDKKDALASGEVMVFQKDRQARSQKAVYNDKKEEIILTGKVEMKTAKEWLRCQKVIVSVKKETFEAVGKVESHFKLKK